jgi:hypothetical protein
MNPLFRRRRVKMNGWFKMLDHGTIRDLRKATWAVKDNEVISNVMGCTCNKNEESEKVYETSYIC